MAEARAVVVRNSASGSDKIQFALMIASGYKAIDSPATSAAPRPKSG